MFPPVLRYRDNFLVIPDPPNNVNGYNLERVQQVLSEISGKELTVEGSRRSLDFLECTLTLSEGAPGVYLKRPIFQVCRHVFTPLSGETVRRFQSKPATHAPLTSP